MAVAQLLRAGVHAPPLVVGARLARAVGDLWPSSSSGLVWRGAGACMCLASVEMSSIRIYSSSRPRHRLSRGSASTPPPRCGSPSNGGVKSGAQGAQQARALSLPPSLSLSLSLSRPALTLAHCARLTGPTERTIGPPTERPPLQYFFVVSHASRAALGE